jgi:hypothetical protein
MFDFYFAFFASKNKDGLYYGQAMSYGLGNWGEAIDYQTCSNFPVLGLRI